MMRGIRRTTQFPFKLFGLAETKCAFLKNGPFPASFSFIFVFSTKHYNCYSKCEKYPFSIRCWDFAPQPSGCESPPKTTQKLFMPC